MLPGCGADPGRATWTRGLDEELGNHVLHSSIIYRPSAIGFGRQSPISWTGRAVVVANVRRGNHAQACQAIADGRVVHPPTLPPHPLL